MSDHASQPVERQCDVCIVGGSAAGLAAALQLGRQRRSVIVVDDGQPRNAPAAHVHGYLGHEGAAPSQLTGTGRDEVRRYGGEILVGRAHAVGRTDDGRFRVDLTNGHAVVSRRVLAATGLVDQLPDIEGLAGHWGRQVIHCPFCHGYEVRDRRIALVVTHPMALHTAALFRQLSSSLTVIVHDPAGIDDGDLDALRRGGVEVLHARVRRIVADPDGRLEAVDTTAGVVKAEAVVVGARFEPRAQPFAALGLHPVEHPSSLGDVLDRDAMGRTSVPGVYAAGNVADPSQQVLQAAADGGRVGAMIAFDLAEEDLRSASRPSANQADWDRRYGTERLWSGNPNGSLVAEVGGLSPGRALDVGAGEGGDALWLAEHGWEVTASDISTRALDRVQAEANRRGLRIECRHADANGVEAFGTGTFDLVSAHYASIPRTPDHRGVSNILGAVAPGGTLLVVSHDLEPMRTPAGTLEHARPFDPDAYVRVDDFVAAVAGSPEWDVEIFGKRPRPPGAASAHHVEDVVLRARRIPA